MPEIAQMFQALHALLEGLQSKVFDMRCTIAVSCGGGRAQLPDVPEIV